MSRLTKDNAVAMLVNLFDSHSLSFRDIDVLKSVFDEAVQACDEVRSEMLADYHLGKTGIPSLHCKDVEDDFYMTLESEVYDELNHQGFTVNEVAIKAIANIVFDKAGYEQYDMYMLP